MIDSQCETLKFAPVIANNSGYMQAEQMIASTGPRFESPGRTEIIARVTAIKTKLGADLRRASPTISDESFEAISQLIIGPWLLLTNKKPEDLESDPEVKSNTEKELCARMQQEFVHYFYFSMSEHASEGYRKNANTMIQSMERAADSATGKDFELSRFLNGIKSELAIVRTLTDNGFKVYLPDYLKRTDAKKGEFSETLEWDVLAGVDLVGVAPNGVIFLIDAKERKYSGQGTGEVKNGINSEVTFSRRETLQTLNSLPHSLQAQIAEIRQTAGNPQAKVKRITITIPTDSTHLGRLGPDTLPPIQANRRFAFLKQDDQSAIISELNKYE